ncbi:MAG: hypothetical protein Kow0079_13450 [Vicingaceae bacterium]
MACPYESPVELVTYEAADKIDKDLLGDWVTYHKDGSKEELTLTKATKTVYHVYHDEYGPKNKKKASNYYRAYLTSINDIPIFNVESKDGKYYFFNYAWTGKNTFYIQAVNNDYVEENFKVDSVTTANLKKFLEDNIQKAELFDEKIEFIRKNSPEDELQKAYFRKSGF